MPGLEGDDEELTSGPPERGPRTRLGRLRLDLLVGAVILGAVIVVGRAMSHGSHPANANSTPRPTPSASAPLGGYGDGAPDSGSGLLNGAATFTVRSAGTGAGSYIVVGPRVVNPPLVPRSGDPAQCPVGIRCYTVGSVPAPALAAVQAAYPDMVTESARTVRLDVKNYGSALWFMQISGHQGDKQIWLRLQGLGMNDRARYTVTRAATTTTTTYGNALDQYYVTVRVTAPGRVAEPALGLRILAADVRLLDRG